MLEIQDINTQPQIDISTAKVVKTPQELWNDPNRGYTRPLTEEERAAAVVQVQAKERGEKPTAFQKYQAGVEGIAPEAEAIGTGIVTGGFSTIVGAARGIAEGKIPPKGEPKTVGDALGNMLKAGLDNAMRGIIEPQTTLPTSVSIMKAYPGTDWKTAGVLGSIMEVGLAYPAVFKQLYEAAHLEGLNKDQQFIQAINKLTQKPEYGDAVMAIAKEKNMPWEEVHKQIARGIFKQKNDIPYWDVLNSNMRDATGIDLLSESGFAKVARGGGEEAPKILNAAIQVPSKTGEALTFEGESHLDAIQNAVKAGALTPAQAADFNKEKKGMFKTSDGRLINRDEAQKEFGISHSEEIPQQAPQEPDEISIEAPQKFVEARQKQLEVESANIDKQMRILEAEKERLERNDMVTGAVDKQLAELSKKWNYLDSSIAELIIDPPTLRDMKNNVVRMKVGDILASEEQVARKSTSIGAEAGKAEEKLRQAKIKTYTRLRQNIKEEVNKMVSHIQKLPTQDLPLDYKDKLEEIKSNFDFKKRTGKTLLKRDSMREFIARQIESGDEVNIPDEALALLDKTPLNEMTMEDLRAVHNEIMRLYKQGQLKDKLLTAQQNRKFSDIVKDGVDTITKGKGLVEESSIIKALKEQDKNLFKNTKEGVRYFILNYLRPELMVNMLDDWNVGGINTKCLWDNLSKADDDERIAFDTTNQKIEKIHEGLDTRDAYKPYDVGRFKGMNKANAMKIYALSFNDKGMLHLEGSGINDKDLKVIENFLSPAEKKAVMDMIDFFDNYQYPRLNQVYEDIEGAHLPKEDHYFPITHIEDVSYNKELEKELLHRYYASKPSVEKGFTKSRLGSKKGLSDFDYFKDIYRHIQKVEHYIAFAKAVRDVRKYLTNPEIKTAINQKYGKDYYDILDKWLQDTAYGQLSRQDELLGRVSGFARRQLAPAVLGLNFLTTAKQFIGYLQGMEMAGKSSTLKFLPQFMMNPIKWTNFVKSKSVLMKYRSMRQEREFEEIMNRRGVADVAGVSTMQKGYEKFQKAGLWLTLACDRMIATNVWMGAYNHLKAMGMEEGDIIREADRVVRRTQPMGGLIHLPHVFRGSELQRQITFLKGHTNKFFNLQYEMIAKKAEGKSSNSKFMSQLLFYSLIPAAATFYLNKKRLPEKVKEWVGAIGTQATLSMWGVEGIFQALAMNYWNESTPIESYFTDVKDLLMAKKPEKQIEAAKQLGAALTGFPYIGLKRIFTGKLFGATETKKGRQRGNPENRGTPERRKLSMEMEKVFKEQMA